uniref:Uncharacterized protein n=1 Tax=Panagrolaimus sp. PS1159 TaxID=55785 RepID=A0AC35GPA6_9BILA
MDWERHNAIMNTVQEKNKFHVNERVQHIHTLMKELELKNALNEQKCKEDQAKFESEKTEIIYQMVKLEKQLQSKESTETELRAKIAEMEKQNTGLQTENDEQKSIIESQNEKLTELNATIKNQEKVEIYLRSKITELEKTNERETDLKNKKINELEARMKTNESDHQEQCNQNGENVFRTPVKKNRKEMCGLI